jgi:hypothetical protein
VTGLVDADGPRFTSLRAVFFAIGWAKWAQSQELQKPGLRTCRGIDANATGFCVGWAFEILLDDLPLWSFQ